MHTHTHQRLNWHQFVLGFCLSGLVMYDPGKHNFGLCGLVGNRKISKVVFFFLLWLRHTQAHSPPSAQLAERCDLDVLHILTAKLLATALSVLAALVGETLCKQSAVGL